MCIKVERSLWEMTHKCIYVMLPHAKDGKFIFNAVYLVEGDRRAGALEKV